MRTKTTLAVRLVTRVTRVTRVDSPKTLLESSSGLEEQMWVYDEQPLPYNDQSYQALVVQTIISLKTSFKRQLVKYIPTTGSTHCYFCLKSVRTSCSAKENIM